MRANETIQYHNHYEKKSKTHIMKKNENVYF